MRIKPTNPEQCPRDPDTKRPLSTKGDDGAEGEEKQETSFWIRRLLAGEVELVHERAAPTGLEPITPLTTRAGGPKR